ncbi:lipid-A-disaccharide kinase [Psychrobacter arcticus 273-4]|uniref:Tetraacyldisaccharide 4'-kinase n=1 Tax=Psychrobacter arcticus (strain DSM 17307 / VKM B-2377 / 273-4) TaxID=259536 RepID=LPXK_PSYA2|nr:tetraacyldisaccharide 4'-kinase [Psychrobacter arcticus]Q4FS43.1 RecName: Full=Tetraacyldisaccharide 4'-kinase; AltName: Full=Lipid A 4'-kinase [Psychrobacter arcticus 273-4]AAZ19165.1 lipid-A-disaccharide kinase [Psychrobacter arcticus 273-4]
MNIETTITRAWQRQAAWLWLLLPVSWLYSLLMILRRQAYKAGIFSSYRAPIPVMVIGNITVGGSGKTPLIIALVRHLQQQGIKVGVISRGYGGDSSQMPALVNTESVPNIVGDEPCLIVNMTGVAMAVCPNRQQAMTTLLASYPDLQLIIADDGLQHYALQRDIEWIVVDAARGFGNKQLLPTGFLREPMSRLKGANVVYHQKADSLSSTDDKYDDTCPPTKRLRMHLQPDNLERLWSFDTQSDGLATVKAMAPEKGSRVHAVSGIGYPQRFFDTLDTLGFQVSPHPYPDHHDFSLTELLRYTEHPIIVTSKDAVKIRALLMQETINQTNQTNQTLSDEYNELGSRLWVLPVTAVLSDGCYEILQQQLQTLNIAISSKEHERVIT